VRNMWDFKISFLAPESAQVKKGQEVVSFDTQSLEKNLEEKSAEYDEATKQIERKQTDLAIQTDAQTLALAEAEARLRKAELKTDIPEDLKGRLEALEGRVEKDEAQKEVANLSAKLESTKVAGAADLRALESRRDRAKGRVEDLKAAIEAMHVKAPQDGIVIYKTGWRDEKKKVGDSTWAGEKILELPDLSAMMAKGAFKAIQKKIDPEEYGGSPLLGVNGICIIAHGNSTPLAVKNALRVAAESIEHQVNPHIVEEVRRHNEKTAPLEPALR